MKSLFATWVGWLVVATFCAALCVAPNLATAQDVIEPPPLVWRGDAALRDVFFLNHDLGWAVGDQGTILRTEDGGRSWNLSPVDASCSLRSVHFVDEQNGWAAGGQAVPLVDRTHAVLLRSGDGGRTWRPIGGTLLPAIREMRMVNANSGWAWGTPTQHFPSGIFLTEDGGSSWSDFPQRSSLRWTAVAAAQDGFVVATDQAELGVYDAGQYRPSRHPTLQQAIRKLFFFDRKHGWAIGDREILKSDDCGQTWQGQEMPADVCDANRFEFTTAAQGGGKHWLAGSPGTYVFCHDLESNQWSRARTPIRSTINRLFFIDQNHGWAVGDWGHILVTRDGGQTWQVQRSANNRIGLLVICRSVDSIPFDVLARFSADQGYLTAVMLCQVESVYGDASLRALDAVQRQGVATLVLGNPQSGEDQVSRFVGLIRQLQPTAIVIADSAPLVASIKIGATILETKALSGPVDLAGTVMSAVTQAANPNLDREWIRQTALPPWQTSFLFQTQPKGSEAAWGSPEFLPSLGRNLFDQQLVSRALLSPPAAQATGVELIALGDRSAAATSNLFGGMTKGPLAPPRRPEQSPRGHLGQIKSMINKAVTFHELTTQFDSSPASLTVWRQRVGRMFTDVSPQTAASWLWQLSEGYWRANQLELAAFSRAALLEQFGDHPLAWEARLWLATYYSSIELSWCEFMQQRRLDESAAVRSDPAVKKAGLRSSPEKIERNGVTHLVWTVDSPEPDQPSSDPRADIRGQLPTSRTTDFESFYAQRIAIAQRLLRSIQERDGELMADPQLRFADGLLKRRTEGPLAAESALRKISTHSLSPPQRQAIAREIRLNGSPSWSEMRDVVACAQTASQPFLDGVLDDEVWRNAAESDQIIRLSPDKLTGAAPASASELEVRRASDPNLGQTQLMLAHDDQYLYVAAICHCAAPASGQASAATASKRQRDQMLDPQDQLHIGIDVDRDCRTCFLFTIDGHGSYADQIGDDRLWNPTWYLAHARTEFNWIVEAAIPLDQLGPMPTDSSDSAWGISFRRQRADQTLERWSPVLSTSDKPRLTAEMTKPDFLPPDGVIHFR